MLEVIIIICNY